MPAAPAPDLPKWPLRRWQRYAPLLAFLLYACASSAPPAHSTLDGHWRLDRSASDNVAARLDQAIRQAQARLRHRRPGGPGGPGGAGGPGGLEEGDSAGDLLGNGLIIGPDFHELRERLLPTLASPATLVIRTSPETVTIQHDDLPARDYQPGESLARMDEYGTARLQARWDGAAFEIRQRYTSGARLTERYEVARDGSLHYTRSLQDPTLGKLELHSVYQRAAQDSGAGRP